VKYKCNPKHFNQIGKEIVSDSWLHAFFVWMNNPIVSNKDKTISKTIEISQRMSGHTLSKQEKNAKLQLLENIIKTYE